MKIIEELKTCAGCQIEFTSNAMRDELGNVLFEQKYCEECTEKHLQEEEDRKKQEIIKARESAFLALCPPRYRESDLSRISPVFAKASEQCLELKDGIGMVGTSRTGKTRALYAILRRFVLAGKKCAAVNSCEFARIIIKQYSDDKSVKEEAIVAIKSFFKAEILLLDDIGKAKMTDSGEMALYDLLEHRYNQCLPTLWSANAKGAELLSMFSHDRGTPIIERLKETSTIYADWSKKA